MTAVPDPFYFHNREVRGTVKLLSRTACGSELEAEFAVKFWFIKHFFEKV